MTAWLRRASIGRQGGFGRGGFCCRAARMGARRMLPALTARKSLGIDVFSKIVENNQLASIAFALDTDRRPMHASV